MIIRRSLIVALLLTAFPVFCWASQATLTWGAVAAADSYRVERSTDGGTTWVVQAASATGTSFNQTGLIDGQNYCYSVFAKRAGWADSPRSNVVCATPGAPSAPASVVLVVAP